MGGRPKASKPKKTAQEKAREIRQARELDKEIAESERRFKALARGKLGSKSLLADSGMAEPVDSAAPKSVYGVKQKPKKRKFKQTITPGDQYGDSGSDGGGM